MKGASVVAVAVALYATVDLLKHTKKSSTMVSAVLLGLIVGYYFKVKTAAEVGVPEA